MAGEVIANKPWWGQQVAPFGLHARQALGEFFWGHGGLSCGSM
jgi:hypothetical protein